MPSLRARRESPSDRPVIPLNVMITIDHAWIIAGEAAEGSVMGNDQDPEDIRGYPYDPVLHGIGHSLRLLYDTQDQGGLCGNIAHLLLQLSQIPSETVKPSPTVSVRQG